MSGNVGKSLPEGVSPSMGQNPVVDDATLSRDIKGYSAWNKKHKDVVKEVVQKAFGDFGLFIKSDTELQIVVNRGNEKQRAVEHIPVDLIENAETHELNLFLPDMGLAGHFHGQNIEEIRDNLLKNKDKVKQSLDNIKMKKQDEQMIESEKQKMANKPRGSISFINTQSQGKQCLVNYGKDKVVAFPMVREASDTFSLMFSKPEYIDLFPENMKISGTEEQIKEQINARFNRYDLYTPTPSAPSPEPAKPNKGVEPAKAPSDKESSKYSNYRLSEKYEKEMEKQMREQELRQKEEEDEFRAALEEEERQKQMGQGDYPLEGFPDDEAHPFE